MSANIRVQEYSPPVLREFVGSASIGRAVVAQSKSESAGVDELDVWIKVQNI